MFHEVEPIVFPVQDEKKRGHENFLYRLQMVMLLNLARILQEVGRQNIEPYCFFIKSDSFFVQCEHEKNEP